MKNSVMISIQPYWVFLIIAHKKGWNVPQRKTVEVRKDYPKSPEWDKKTFIYCSKDKKSFKRIPKEYQPLMKPLLGKVVGEFTCEEASGGYWEDPWANYLQKKSCLTWEEIKKYSKGKKLYGWHISDLKVYDTPKELGEFSLYEKKDCDHFWCGICGERTQNDVINCKNLVCEHKAIKRPFQSWGYCVVGWAI